MRIRFHGSGFLLGLLLAGSLANTVSAQTVGSRVEVSPVSLPNLYYPATILSVDATGFNVRLDPRPGYGDDERCYVQRKWTRPLSAAPAAAMSSPQSYDQSNSSNQGAPASSAGSYAVGSHVDVSPLSMPNMYHPATILSADATGYFVKLDPRPGYGYDEKCYVQKKWVRALSGGPSGQNNASLDAAAATNQNNQAQAPSGAAASTGSSFSVGQRVEGNNVDVHWPDYWRAGTITKIVSPGVYEIHFDVTGLNHVMRADKLRASNRPAPSTTGGATGAANTAAPGINANTKAQAPPPQTNAGKGSPPGGLYQVDMMTSSMYIHIGTLEIRGNTYRGLNTGAAFHPYSIDGGGNMNLSAGLAGMPEGFTLKSVSYVGADSVGRALIKIRYIGHSNAHDVMDAVHQK
ncbi:hypothetical protein BH11CYA1_BH11CYA1_12800 [soil metagenome]